MSTEVKTIREKVDSASSKQTKQPVTVIVGSGPAGLSSAFSLMLRNHKIILIDNRDEDTRKQRVYIQGHLIRKFFQLSSLPSLDITISGEGHKAHHSLKLHGLEGKILSEEHQADLDFFKKLTDENCVISIEYLKKYMKNKLVSMSKKKTITYESLDVIKFNKLYANVCKEQEALQSSKSSESSMLDKLAREFDGEMKKVSEYIDSSNVKIEFCIKSINLLGSLLLSVQYANEVFRLSDPDVYKSKKEMLLQKENQILQEKNRMNEQLYKLYGDRREDVAKKLKEAHGLYQSGLESIRSEKMADGLRVTELLTLVDNFIREISGNTSKHMVHPSTIFDVTGALELKIGSQYQVVKLDSESQTLTLRDSAAGTDSEIQFDNFVAADGAKHEMVNLLNTSLKEPVKYSSICDPRQFEHAVAVLKLKESVDLNEIPYRIVGPHLIGSSRLELTDLEIFKKIGWDKDYLPAYSVDFNPKTREFYIFSEVAESIFKTCDKKFQMEKLQTFSELVVQLEFKLDSNKIDRLDFVSTFKVQPMCASASHVKLGKNGTFFIVGDAYLSANPNFGHGVEKAITDGNALHSCFAEDGDLLTLEPFVANAQKNKSALRELDTQFKLCLENRHAKKGYSLFFTFSSATTTQSVIGQSESMKESAIERHGVAGDHKA